MALRLETIRARVGATLLDVLTPGWADSINLGKLDLSNCQACVLGQLFGEYTKGAETLFAMRSAPASDLDTDKFNDGIKRAANEAGFACDRNASGVKYSKWGTYARLTTAWKREVVKRQTKRQTKPATLPEYAGRGTYCHTCNHSECGAPVDKNGYRITA